MHISIRHSKGFTLIELMVCVAVIAVLCAVALPHYQRYLAKTRRSEGVIGLKALYNCEIAYYGANSSFAFSHSILPPYDITGIGIPPQLGFSLSGAAKFYNFGTTPRVLDTAVLSPLGLSPFSDPNVDFFAEIEGQLDSDPMKDSLDIATTPYLPIDCREPGQVCVGAYDDVMN